MRLSRKTKTILIILAEMLFLLFLSVRLGYVADRGGQELIRYDMKAHGRILSGDPVVFSGEFTATRDATLTQVALYYSAKDENFEGKANFKIYDGDELLLRSIHDLEKTDEEYEYKFYDLNQNLQKGRKYRVECFIRQNSDNFRVYSINHDGDGKEDNLFTDRSGTSPFAQIRYAGTEKFTWGDLLWFLIPISLATALFGVLAVYGKRVWLKRAAGSPFRFFEKYHSEFFLILLFIYLGLYEFYYAYMKEIFISPDGSNYLSEAEAILQGYGYNQGGPAGYDRWFSSWPVGYPAMIAAVSFVTGLNVYLSSKILSLILVGCCLVVLYLRFRKESWIYGAVFLNVGFLMIYKQTWSENPFILALLIFAVSLDEIIESRSPKRRWYVFLGLSMALAFLTRYFGIVTGMITAVAIIVLTIMYIVMKRSNNASGAVSVKGKIPRLIAVDAAVSVGIILYYLLNLKMSGHISGVDRTIFHDDYLRLMLNLLNAIVTEVMNAFRTEMPVFLVIVCLIVLGLLIRQLARKRIDYKITFIAMGLLYDAVFVIVRFYSTMDGFGYRFFAPGSILIMIGVMGFAKELLGRKEIWLCLVSVAVLTGYVAFTSLAVVVNRHNQTAYGEFEDSIERDLSEVPLRSTVIAFDGDYRSAVIRPDVNYVADPVMRTEEMEDIFAKYSRSDYICIKAGVVATMLDNPSEYSGSVIEFFKDAEPEAADSEDSYIVISVKDRALVN